MAESCKLSNRRKLSGLVKNSRLPLLFAVLLPIFSGTALAVPGFPNLVKPADGNTSQKDECAGTLKRYYFPASGYKARKESKSSRNGHLLYLQLNCVQCHAIAGIGGELGPALDGIGAYRGKTWLTAHLSDPDRAYKSFPTILKERSNIMPHPGLTSREAEQISDYLLTLAEPKKGFSITHHQLKKSNRTVSKDWKPNEPNQASSRGKELFFGLGCAACHSLDGSKDRFGPDLAGLGSRVSEKDLEEILSGSVASSVMRKQAKGLAKAELEDIQAYLLTLPNHPSKK
ncbi:MAG: cytochrome c [Candidatus Obscuribacterales bacterium]|nr:cytochrome c [Candidatus Obscuribacterales bacterium]